jgi:hypothetical protein
MSQQQIFLSFLYPDFNLAGRTTKNILYSFFPLWYYSSFIMSSRPLLTENYPNLASLILSFNFKFSDVLLKSCINLLLPFTFDKSRSL